MRQYKHLSFSIDKHVARVALNRPPVNALGREFVDELSSLARMLRTERDVWVVAVESLLPVFCAGADLKERAGASPAAVSSAVGKIQTMVRAWLALPQPVLMRLDGAALGGGLEFALTADILCASDDIVVGFPEVRLGIIPAAGGTQLLSRKTNAGIAKKWILTAKKFSAADALRDGVLDIVVPRSVVVAEFDGLVSMLASLPPRALREAKKAVNAGIGLVPAKAFAFERSCYHRLINTSDRREALQAFLEKRQPKFTGS